MNLTAFPYISFEGPIAVGKTTLAQLLSEYIEAQLILESFAENEFLTDFYHDMSRWGLPMQLWFLVDRFRQRQAVTRPLSKAVVADYSYLKNSTFASMLLKGRELRLYDELESALVQEVSLPDLVVFLDANNEVLLNRIRNRNRPYEQSISSQYLNDLRDAYEKKLVAVPQLKILRFDTSVLDLTSKEQLWDLFNQILRTTETQLS